MIYIKENQLVNSNIVPTNERVIGVKNTNNVEIREFVFPSLYKRIELTDDSFVFLLNIEPVNSEEAPYSQLLDKEIIGDRVHLKWNITRTHTKDVGTLYTTIQILNEIGDIVWESYKLEFIVVSGISATESLVEIPQNVLEQLVMQAGAYAQNAKVEADKIRDYIHELHLDGSPMMVYEETYYEFPNIGNVNTFYISTSDNTLYRWDDVDLKYYSLSGNLSIEGTEDNYIIIGGTANG